MMIKIFYDFYLFSNNPCEYCCYFNMRIIIGQISYSIIIILIISVPLFYPSPQPQPAHSAIRKDIQSDICKWPCDFYFIFKKMFMISTEF